MFRGAHGCGGQHLPGIPFGGIVVSRMPCMNRPEIQTTAPNGVDHLPNDFPYFLEVLKFMGYPMTSWLASKMAVFQSRISCLQPLCKYPWNSWGCCKSVKSAGNKLLNSSCGWSCEPWWEQAWSCRPVPLSRWLLHKNAQELGRAVGENFRRRLRMHGLWLWARTSRFTWYVLALPAQALYRKLSKFEVYPPPVQPSSVRPLCPRGRSGDGILNSIWWSSLDHSSWRKGHNSGQNAGLRPGSAALDSLCMLHQGTFTCQRCFLGALSPEPLT